MQAYHNHPCSIPLNSLPLNLITNVFTIALPTLLTNVLLGSAVEDNSMLKDRFTVLGTMMSSLPKFGMETSPEVIGFGQSHCDCA